MTDDDYERLTRADVGLGEDIPEPTPHPDQDKPHTFEPSIDPLHCLICWPKIRRRAHPIHV